MPELSRRLLQLEYQRHVSNGLSGHNSNWDVATTSQDPHPTHISIGAVQAAALVISLVELGWHAYLLELAQQPLWTKAVTAACITGISDIIAQNINLGRFTLWCNWKHTLAVSCYGFLYTGPAAHFWQAFLEWASNGRSDLHTVLLKVLVDQTTYGPFCNFLFLTFAVIVLEGNAPAIAVPRIKNNYLAVQCNGWRLWPLAALINYKFVPLQFRVLFINVVALLWTTFLLLRSKRISHPESPKTR